MKPVVVPVLVGVVALALSALPARRAVADNETSDTEISIAAPLDAVDCTAQTIGVLGLTIDISAATIEAGNNATPTSSSTSPTPTPTADDHAGNGGTDGSGGHGGRGIGVTPSSGCYYFCLATPAAAPSNAQGAAGCAALVRGQPVEVRLAGDQAPFAATEVKQNGDGEDIKVKAPIQAIDSNAQTITALGLTIDVSGAGLDGADDGGDSSQPIDVNQLILGQFVQVRLTSSTPPLTATELEVKNFTNQTDVEVEEAHHDAVDDTDADGNPVDDVEVDVTAMVGVQNPAGAGLVRKQLQFHTRSNGSFSLTGLPTGLAQIHVTRVHDGITQVGHRAVLVRPNTARHVRVRLHTPH